MDAVGAGELYEGVAGPLVADVGQADVHCAGPGPTWLIADAGMADLDVARGEEEGIEWLVADVRFADTLALVS